MKFKKNIGIDLGTDTTQIYLNDHGVVLNEPSIAAFNNRTNRVVAYGVEAKKMLSRTPAHITVARPVINGVIADFEMAREMVQRFMKNERMPWSWTTRVVVGVPTNLTEVERKSVEDLVKESGGTEVHLVEQPLAAALGSQLDIQEPTAYLVLDVGAGTTDMAIISMNGIVTSRRLKVAGDYLNNEIVKAMRDELKLHIGEPTAEEIKVAVGTAAPQSERLEISVRGRDVSSGLPREQLVKDTQVRGWLVKPLKHIVEGLKDLIESSPPELVGDIHKNGIYMCGGMSQLRGLPEMLERETGVEVKLVPEPLTCVVRGTGIIVENFGKYKHLLDNFSSLKI
ncbi:MAG: rod shape-determining protein [Candidatus Brennerbacteria bacterium]|nr:rod shape-determining protein [Candidatus Brennerbacteria bacterium]